MLASELLLQMAPSVSVTAFAETPVFDILVNGVSAAGSVSVTYGAELTFRLSGAAETDVVYLGHAD